MNAAREGRLARYRDTVRETSRGFYVGIVRRFLESGARWTREDLTAYAKGLQASGTRPSSIDTYLGAIRRFGAVNGLAWPGIDWQWDERKDPVRRIGALPEFVATLVDAARAGRLPPRMRAWLALSTLYACRAAELRMWTPADRGEDTVYIRRVKDGQSRWYWLPPAVRPHLEGAPKRPVHRAQELYEEWHAALRQLRLEVPAWAAWHAIRRGLVHELRNRGVPDDDLRHFIAWAGEGTAIMDPYANPTAFLGAGGRVQSTPRDAAAMDRAVWRVHPFLPLWSQGGPQLPAGEPRGADAPADG
jgi:hypothetical protein